MNTQDCEQLMLFQEDSLVNRTVSLENDLRKMTKDTCGPSFCELSENCTHGTLLAKMLMAYFQQYMSPFAPTWKVKVTKSGRSVFRLVLSERTMKDTGFAFLASPRASQDFKPIRSMTPKECDGKHGLTLNSSIGNIYPERIGQYINPQFAEWMMGFPLGWGAIEDTKKECNATETR